MRGEREEDEAPAERCHRDSMPRPPRVPDPSATSWRNPALTDEEEEGLRAALASLRTGKGRTIEQVRQTIDGVLRR